MNYNGKIWKENIDVADFIKNNYNEYLGDDKFLTKISNKTKIINDKINELLIEEAKKGVLDIDTENVSGINNFNPGYIDKNNEVIFGLQTDAPLKRIINPFGGIRMVYSSLKSYNYNVNKDFDKYFSLYRKTHNEGVFDAYTDTIKKFRHVGLITGLPDAYGRGRIIGDYRRIALYGIDRLIEEKKKDFIEYSKLTNEETIRIREEISMQLKALDDMKKMALRYGYDISLPAKNSFEAVQWTYFGYLAAIKENNGAATSFGRIDAFLDIFFEKDLKDKKITEDQIQELIDQLIIKLRLVRHLRTPEYNDLFAGDPTWVTMSLGGMLDSKKSLVTKTTYRILNTLINLGAAPEPNITILWSNKLPKNFKDYCSKISIITDSIQYENDDIMKPIYGNDYGIACCVSAMKLGHQMQFFGARCNIAKALLYAINGGIDEIKKDKVIDEISPITDEILNYNKVMSNYDKVLDIVCKNYVDALNIIHYMHDKYAYEAGQMALHDTNVERLMAFGISGFSVAVDSLSAIKFAKVKPLRDENNIAIDFSIEGDYPKYGNNIEKVDKIAVDLVNMFINKLNKHKLYRNAKATLSVLTITSNVVYGKKTGATPDGRKANSPFAPGANPMHGRDTSGALASLSSVAKIPYKNVCEDGVSNTFSIIPNALGHNIEEQIENLTSLIDGYFKMGAHHLNVNVLNKETLIDATNNPDKYPNLTIRVSGYAVKFNSLNQEQKLEVISRTFHEKI